MPASPVPLMHRLRRYLRVVALLCVGLVVMKSGVAALCAAEAFAAPLSAAVSAGLDAGADLAVDNVAAAAADAETGPCWHSGAGGCHCACAHVMTLLPALSIVAGPASGAQRFSAAPCLLRGAPQDDALRPPIA